MNKVKDELFSMVNTDYYDKLKYVIYKSNHADKLLVHRAITLPTNIKELEKLDWNGVGVYWTYDLKKAEAYCSRYDREFIFTAFADVNSINWEETIRASIYNLSHEKEINIIDRAELELISVYLKDAHFKHQENQENMERLSKMFHHKKDPEIWKFLDNKRKDISTITFEEPIFIKA